MVRRFSKVSWRSFPGHDADAGHVIVQHRLWLRLSHFNVTPAQFFSVTVAWSFLSSRQYTRAPTSKDLDWDPVIQFAVSVAVLLASITLAAQPSGCHDTL
jgi:hypothetical protein